jgi:hypothetical protein
MKQVGSDFPVSASLANKFEALKILTTQRVVEIIDFNSGGMLPEEKCDLSTSLVFKRLLLPISMNV